MRILSSSISARLAAALVLGVSTVALWFVFPTDGQHAVTSAWADNTTYEVVWKASKARIFDIQREPVGGVSSQTYASNVPLGVSGWDVTYCMGGTVNAQSSCSNSQSVVHESWTAEKWSALHGPKLSADIVRAFPPNNHTGTVFSGPVFGHCAYQHRNPQLSPGIDFTNPENVDVSVASNGSSLFDGNAASIGYGSSGVGYSRSGSYSLQIYCTLGDPVNVAGFVDQLPVIWKVTGSITY